jgi:hypothetical protein
MSNVRDVLKFKDGGLSVEEARRKMLEAGEAPRGLNPTGIPALVKEEVAPVVVPTAVADAIEPEFEEEVPVVPVVPVAVAPTPVPIPPKVERVETDQFVGEIKQEGGKWVAELRYKTGGGTERFIKSTKNELMLALLEGKGHATMRVHKAVRREKLGWSELDRQYALPAGVTAEDFEKMPDKQQDAMLWTIASQQTLLFNEAHPEFYKTPNNAKAIDNFLTEHKLPITLRNLEYAFEDLTESELLEVRPTEPAREAPITSSAPAAAPVPTDSAPASATPPAAPAAALGVVAPAVTVRKRGTTGLQPGQSSSPTELGGPEDGGKPRELSEAELRKLPMSELKRISDQDRRQRAGTQR